MKAFQQYLRENPTLAAKTWLVLGKGPSFGRLDELASPEHVRLGINHTVRETRLDVCHVTDLEVIAKGGEDIERNAAVLLMPEYPHVSYSVPGLKGVFHKPGERALGQLFDDYPVLERLSAADRLLWYRLSSHEYADDSQVVRAGSFSASTVISLLGTSGITRVRTLGVDGGTRYSDRFTDLDTRLEAGQPSFDVQFAEMAQARHRWGIDLLPLDDEEEIAVYVGSEAEQEVAYQVLKHSIERRSSRSVRVHHLGRCVQDRLPTFRDITGDLPTGTPFSLQRFAIPDLQQRTGRAIYLDSDMQVFTDITGLWTQPMGENGFLSAGVRPGSERPAQLSVMLIDCERVDWQLAQIAAALRRDPEYYDAMFLHGAGLGTFARDLPWQWNSLEHYREGDVKLLHYTNMATQPWLSWQNPLARVWFEEFFPWLVADPANAELVMEHIEKSWIRPSIAQQIETQTLDPLLLPAAVRRCDSRQFVPPHAFFRSERVRRLTGYGSDRPSAMQLAGYRAISRLRSLALALGLYAAAGKARRVAGKLRRALSTGIGRR